MSRLRNVSPEGICQNCGRVEVASAYCSYCFARPFRGIMEPTPLDIYAVRHALIVLHGWKSPNLCFEITRGRPRLIAHAEAAGLNWKWPIT